MITISSFFQVVTVTMWITAPETPATTATASPSPTRSVATATRASTAPTARSTSTSAPGVRAGTDDASTLTDRTSKSPLQFRDHPQMTSRIFLHDVIPRNIRDIGWIFYNEIWICSEIVFDSSINKCTKLMTHGTKI